MTSTMKYAITKILQSFMYVASLMIPPYNPLKKEIATIKNIQLYIAELIRVSSFLTIMVANRNAAAVSQIHTSCLTCFRKSKLQAATKEKAGTNTFIPFIIKNDMYMENTIIVAEGDDIFLIIVH